MLVVMLVIILLLLQIGGGKGAGNPGGLLIIYGKSVVNKCSITAGGSSGGNCGLSDSGSGGGSGGGSINIFYSVHFEKGNISANGGSAGRISGRGALGAQGGNGCISHGSIASGSYVATP